MKDANSFEETLTGSTVNSGMLNEYMNFWENSGSFCGKMNGLLKVPSSDMYVRYSRVWKLSSRLELKTTHLPLLDQE